MKFEWEHIWESSLAETFRAQVPGGWVVANCQKENNIVVSESMVFIPDPNHEWEID